MRRPSLILLPAAPRAWAATLRVGPGLGDGTIAGVIATATNDGPRVSSAWGSTDGGATPWPALLRLPLRRS